MKFTKCVGIFLVHNAFFFNCTLFLEYIPPQTAPGRPGHERMEQIRSVIRAKLQDCYYEHIFLYAFGFTMQYYVLPCLAIVAVYGRLQNCIVGIVLGARSPYTRRQKGGITGSWHHKDQGRLSRIDR